jgi:hypothetical protein
MIKDLIMDNKNLKTINQRRLLLVLVSVIVTFVILRVYLHLFPATNLDIAGYNIHHLFTGILLMTLAGLPLIFFSGDNRFLDLASLVFGAGLSMVLDEWVYMIVTDGSDAAYLLPVSLWGAIVMITLVVCYCLILLAIFRSDKNESSKH